MNREHPLVVENPEIRAGIPTLRGTRMGALEIADLARSETAGYLYDSYPTLTPELLAAAISYARDVGWPGY